MKEVLIQIRKTGKAFLRHYLIRSISKAREEVIGDKGSAGFKKNEQLVQRLYKAANRRSQVCWDYRAKEREGEGPDHVGSS